MRALCLIPPATFAKGLPVSASIRLPAGTAEVQWWFVVAPLMQEKESFRGRGEVRWRYDAGNYTDSSVTGVRVEGRPDTEPGGIIDQLPGTLPDTCTMFDFDPRNSGGGGSSPDPGAEWVRITIIPEGGNNGGAIWCGAVVMALDAEGNELTFTPTTGSQTFTLSFSNTTTCRWSIVAATGISTATPDAANDSLTTASSARASTDCSSAGITTAANVLGVLVQVYSSAPAGTITAPSGWTRITSGTAAVIVLAYIASSSAFSAQKGTVTYTSSTMAAQACIAAFNGDDQATGQPMAKRWGGVPHAGIRSRRVW